MRPEQTGHEVTKMASANMTGHHQYWIDYYSHLAICYATGKDGFPRHPDWSGHCAQAAASHGALLLKLQNLIRGKAEWAERGKYC